MVAAIFVDADARAVATALDADGIDTRPFFTGAHEQPVFKSLFGGERHPITESLTRHGILLPSSPGLDEGAVDRVARSLERALAVQ